MEMAVYTAQEQEVSNPPPTSPLNVYLAISSRSKYPKKHQTKPNQPNQTDTTGTEHGPQLKIQLF